MHQIPTLGHNDAQRAIAAIQAELARLRVPAAIAVVDPAGEVIALVRMDGVPIACVGNATNKAFTAARLQKSSRDVGKSVRDPVSGYDISYYNDTRYIGWGGGLPVVVNGQTVGAVAVSGLSEDDDEKLAALGIAAIMAK